jgi:hypothetical protein
MTRANKIDMMWMFGFVIVATAIGLLFGTYTQQKVWFNDIPLAIGKIDDLNGKIERLEVAVEENTKVKAKVLEECRVYLQEKAQEDR